MIPEMLTEIPDFFNSKMSCIILAALDSVRSRER